MRYCTECGRPLVATGRFCAGCGAEIAQADGHHDPVSVVAPTEVNERSDEVVVPGAAAVLSWVVIAAVILFVLVRWWSSGWDLGVLMGALLVGVPVVLACARIVSVARRNSTPGVRSRAHWYDARAVIAFSPLAAIAVWIGVWNWTGVDGFIKALILPSSYSGGYRFYARIADMWIVIGCSIAIAVLVMRARPRTQTPPTPPIAATNHVATNSLAIASFVLSLLWLGGVGAILGVVFGHVALGQIRRNGQAGRGLALAGTILGWIEIAIAALFILVVLGSV